MRYLLLFIALLTCALPATAQQEWPLVWADEFDGEGLPDTSSWRYNVGGNGWGNQELQYYTALNSIAKNPPGRSHTRSSATTTTQLSPASSTTSLESVGQLLRFDLCGHCIHPTRTHSMFQPTG